MKRIILFLTTILLATTLAACGSKDTDFTKEIKDKYKDLEYSSYTLEYNGFVSEVTLYHDGTNISAQTLKTSGPYSSFGAEDKESAKELMDPLAKQYKNIDGVTHNISYNKDGLVETLVIDYEVGKEDELDRFTLSPGILEDGEYTLELAEEILLSIGFTKD